RTAIVDTCRLVLDADERTRVVAALRLEVAPVFRLVRPCRFDEDAAGHRRGVGRGDESLGGELEIRRRLGRRQRARIHAAAAVLIVDEETQLVYLVHLPRDAAVDV